MLLFINEKMFATIKLKKCSKMFLNFVILLLLCSIHISQTITWTDEDSIIMEAPGEINESEGIRWKSQRQFPGFPPGWPGGIFNPGAGSLPGGGSIFGQRPPLLPGIGGGTPQCHTREGEAGTCASFKQCYPILYTPENDFKQVGNLALAQIYMESSAQCGNGENSESAMSNHLYASPSLAQPTTRQFPRVCCGTNPSGIIKLTTPAPNWPWTLLTTTTTRTTTTKMPYTTARPRPIWGSNHIGGPGGHRPPSPPSTKQTTTTTPAPVITSNCGATRVIGGQVPSPGSYPFQVALIHNNRFFCGGSLVDNLHVLTAAHCFQTFSARDLTLMKVILGDHDLSRRDEAMHLVRNVKTLIKHRGFSRVTLRDDIAIIKLDEVVPFSDTIMPICLTGAEKVNDGHHEATLAGWGSIYFNGATQTVLRHVTMRVWTNQECQQRYGAMAPYGIWDKQICAASAGKDACQGDSGGALFRRQNSNGPVEQIGIVSWGIGCGAYPGIYTRISSYLPWIEKNRGRYR